MSRVAVNICVHVFVWMFAFFYLSKYLGVEWLHYVVGVCVTFLSIYQTVFQSGCTILFPLSSV